MIDSISKPSKTMSITKDRPQKRKHLSLPKATVRT